jgi:hypothetical protein
MLKERQLQRVGEFTGFSNISNTVSINWINSLSHKSSSKLGNDSWIITFSINNKHGMVSLNVEPLLSLTDLFYLPLYAHYLSGGTKPHMCNCTLLVQCTRTRQHKVGSSNQIALSTNTIGPLQYRLIVVQQGLFHSTYQPNVADQRSSISPSIIIKLRNVRNSAKGAYH